MGGWKYDFEKDLYTYLMIKPQSTFMIKWLKGYVYQSTFMIKWLKGYLKTLYMYIIWYLKDSLKS
jgi:hypothetical protein